MLPCVGLVSIVVIVEPAIAFCLVEGIGLPIVTLEVGVVGHTPLYLLGLHATITFAHIECLVIVVFGVG